MRHSLPAPWRPTPPGPGRLYVGTLGYGLFRTCEDGASWRPIDVHIGLGSITGLALSPQSATEPTTLYCTARDTGTRGAFYRSNDAGSLWGIPGGDDDRCAGR